MSALMALSQTLLVVAVVAGGLWTVVALILDVEDAAAREQS